MTRVWIDGSWFIMVVGFIVIIYLYYVMSRHALKLLIHWWHLIKSCISSHIRDYLPFGMQRNLLIQSSCLALIISSWCNSNNNGILVCFLSELNLGCYTSGWDLLVFKLSPTIAHFLNIIYMILYPALMYVLAIFERFRLR